MHKLIKKSLLMVKHVFIPIKIFFIKLKIKSVKNSCYLAKRGNYYNPTLGSTVYGYDDKWRVARYNTHFGFFVSKKETMNTVFYVWLEDKNFSQIIKELEGQLNYRLLKNLITKFQVLYVVLVYLIFILVLLCFFIF